MVKDRINITADNYFTVPFEMGQVIVYTNTDGSLTAIEFDLERSCDESPIVSTLGEDLKRYFDGDEIVWDLELDLRGLTDFRRRVYDSVARIPYGRTATYGEIAIDIGCSGGARAVGQAMGTNRFPLVIPCHRVISGNRKIGGFSSGIDLKRYLLRLEGVDL